MTPNNDGPGRAQPSMGFVEFVALIAAMSAIGALAIDTMLPALPQIGEALHIHAANERQWIVTAYLLGLGVAQIFYGALADRFGRRPVLMAGLGLFCVATLVGAASTSFATMIVARALQGVGGAAARVMAVSIVRDRYSGRQMAKVMSLSFIVFMAAPIVAPSLGQAIMLVASWRMIFGLLAALSIILLTWTALRLRETLHEEDRAPLSPKHIVHTFGVALTTRISVGYMLATSLVMGGLFSFINSAQQVFGTVFHRAEIFPIVFAMISGSMAMSGLLNSQIVERFGMRRVSHTALLGYILIAATHVLVARSGHETVWTFAALQSTMMFCFGLLGANFNAMAMDPLGHLAGVASSVQGFCSTVTAALLGIFVGQHFNGTIIPLTESFAAFGTGALVLVLIAEKGRLFHASTGKAAAFAR